MYSHTQGLSSARNI